jgi:hypothetical protein
MVILFRVVSLRLQVIECSAVRLKRKKLSTTQLSPISFSAMRTSSRSKRVNLHALTLSLYLLRR